MLFSIWERCVLFFLDTLVLDSRKSFRLTVYFERCGHALGVVLFTGMPGQEPVDPMILVTVAGSVQFGRAEGNQPKESRFAFQKNASTRLRNSTLAYRVVSVSFAFPPMIQYSL